MIHPTILTNLLSMNPHRKISNFTLTHHPIVDVRREMIEGIGA
jgi:hypothetical protein